MKITKKKMNLAKTEHKLLGPQVNGGHQLPTTQVDQNVLAIELLE